jgi:hypothetical protein
MDREPMGTGMNSWNDASTAPLGIKIEVECEDMRRGFYTLPYPCRRTPGGIWVNAQTNQVIDCNPTRWRTWQHA